MPIVKVADLAFARLQSPDLDLAEQFLLDFGMVRVERTPDALYMRGTGPTHHIHVTHLGPPRFIGLAFQAQSEDDLARLARVPISPEEGLVSQWGEPVPERFITHASP
jgi:hypothetical protein